MAARLIEELEGRSQVQCRRIGSSHQPRIPPTQVGVVICMRSPCSPRFSEAVCAGWVVATYPVPGASSPENAQFRSGQLVSEVRIQVTVHLIITVRYPQNLGNLLHDACK